MAGCFNRIEQSTIDISCTARDCFSIHIHTLVGGTVMASLYAARHQVAIVLSGPCRRTRHFSRDHDLVSTLYSSTCNTRDVVIMHIAKEWWRLFQFILGLKCPATHSLPASSGLQQFWLVRQTNVICCSSWLVISSPSCYSSVKGLGSSRTLLKTGCAGNTPTKVFLLHWCYRYTPGVYY